ncbi:neuronal acetylcholine receptor subunit alpha-3-like isoform X2 [Apostichopus japonicus]|uniref:neuronal acetylcholine receptor subunit alpha-3-like isoform X2 n=1 Tax=Stichopus japonicus TaxID=307972 RepID=UPI003AB4A075
MQVIIVSDQKNVMFFSKCILLGIAFILPSCCLTGDCANMNARTALYRKLLDSSTYNHYARPVENSSLPVYVQFRFAPVIHYLVQDNQELQLRGRMALIWNDYRLAWNPDDYGGHRSLDLPVNKIWQPELILYERIPTDTDRIIQKETEVAKVLSDGTVYWYTMASTRSFCFIDIRKFPFDKQNCDVTFTTWMHQKREQQLYHNDDLFINDTYKQNEASIGEWHMTHFHHDPSYRCLYCVEYQSYITYKVTLERYQPWLAMLSFVLPCIVVELITLLLFCFPLGNADVATFGLTCVLALVVFLPMLYNLLPDTGVCFVGIFVVILMIFQAILTIVTIIYWRSKKISGKDCRSGICIALECRHKGSNEGLTQQTGQEPSSSEAVKEGETEARAVSHPESPKPSTIKVPSEEGNGGGGTDTGCKQCVKCNEDFPWKPSFTLCLKIIYIVVIAIFNIAFFLLIKI